MQLKGRHSRYNRTDNEGATVRFARSVGPLGSPSRAPEPPAAPGTDLPENAYDL